MPSYDIKIDIMEAYRFLGGRGEPDADYRRDLENAAAEIQKNIRPRVVEKLLPLERENGLKLGGTCVELPGKAVDALLHDSVSCVIFCATLGTDTDKLIRQWQIRDIAFAMLLDACANSAVENLCDCVNGEVRSEYEDKGLFITDRYSPGYGDFPLDIQNNFCSALDTARKIGVTVGESGLMSPMKSVTAIIGISKNPQRSRETGCAGCIKIKSCTFRERGVTCYGQTL